MNQSPDCYSDVTGLSRTHTQKYKKSGGQIGWEIFVTQGQKVDGRCSAEMNLNKLYSYRVGVRKSLDIDLIGDFGAKYEETYAKGPRLGCPTAC